MATVAVFIALGGASYAALELPPHSVGSRQLRAGSVGRDKLAFPLFQAGASDSTRHVDQRTQCNGGYPLPGEPRFLCVRPRRIVRGVVPRPGLLLRLKHASSVAISVVAGVENTSAAVDSGLFGLQLVVDGRILDERSLTVAGGVSSEFPAVFVRKLASGRHVIGVALTTQFQTQTASRQGKLVVAPVTVLATALPAPNTR
jgi:hypothetical protein